jgi:hypothetical protein
MDSYIDPHREIIPIFFKKQIEYTVSNKIKDGSFGDGAKLGQRAPLVTGRAYKRQHPQ